jgi:hypothetical protein
MELRAMKNKLSALIIVVAIWFGVADVMKNFELLKSEASHLIAKSGLYTLSLGNDGPSDCLREERIAKREAMVAEIEEALARQECESLIAKTAKANQQTVSRASRTRRIVLDQGNEEKAQSQIGAAQRARVEEIARIVAFDIERISKETLRIANEARMIEQRALRTRRHAPLPKAVFAPKPIENLKEEINYEFSNELDNNNADASDENKAAAATSCSKRVSNEKRLKKLVALLPEILQKVGE